MKRRKVDKTQFMDDSAGLFFGNFLFYLEKTLQHREQVYGEIEKPKHEEEEEKWMDMDFTKRFKEWLRSIYFKFYIYPYLLINLMNQINF